MKETVYFGTYTRRTSQGIYKADFDTETGQLSNLELFAAEPSPTYLALTSTNIYTLLVAKTIRGELQPIKLTGLY